MRHRIAIWMVFFLYTTFSFAQKNESGDVLLKKADAVLYDDPMQTLKLGTHLLHNATTNQDKAQTAILLSKADLVIGNYTQSIANIQLALTVARQSGDKKTSFETLLFAAEIYSFIDLFEISKQYRDEAEKIAQANPLFQKKMHAYMMFVQTASPNASNCSNFLKSVPYSDLDQYSFLTKGTALQRTAQAFQKASMMDSAAVYYQKSAATPNQTNAGNYWKMIGLLNYGTYFFDQKDYARAITLLENSVKIERTIHNSHYETAICEKLSDCYLALGNKAMFQEFRRKSAISENDYDTQITVATNFAFEMLQREKEKKVRQSNASQQNISLTLGISALVILLLWLFVKAQFATKINHTKDIINYLKLIKTGNEKQELLVKPSTKSLSIPKETEDLLMSKLEKFESGKKFLNKDMSLAQMAALFDTNTKYLSEVVNKYKGKNINLYINELRIGYIVDKLKQDPKYLNYKVSYLAEECGFSSHSSFSAVFKSITGITPNIFIQFLLEDRHAENTPAELNSLS